MSVFEIRFVNFNGENSMNVCFIKLKDTMMILMMTCYDMFTSNDHFPCSAANRTTRSH